MNASFQNADGTVDTENKKRTDCHRRGAFQPKFYKFVGWYYLGFVCKNGRWVASSSVAKCSDAIEAFRRSEEAWDFGAIVYGDFGRCAICGARFAMGEVWQHDETKDMIHVGHDCADKYTMVSGTDWSALEDERRRAGLAMKTAHERTRADERIRREHPDFVTWLWMGLENSFIQRMAWTFMNRPEEVSERMIAAVCEAGPQVLARHLARLEREAKRAAEASAAVHEGTVGKRQTWPVVLVFTTTFDTLYGVMQICKFRLDSDDTIATFVWKTSLSSSPVGKADVGKKFALTGTVKEHGEYKGEKQTVLSRCKVAEVVS